MREVAKKPGTVTVKVISSQMDKTIVTSLVRKVPHAKYGKYIKRRTKLFAHDPDNQAQIGDIVVIQPNRPLSKKKHWLLVEIVKTKKELN